MMQPPNDQIVSPTGLVDGCKPARSRWLSWLAFAGLFAAALCWQWVDGAFGKDFSSHPDEGAHVVTGLMVRDYLAVGVPKMANPVRFAKGYYARLPKVALGHYPPLFYLVESVFLLPSRTPSAVIVMQAFLAAAWSWLAGAAAHCLLKSRIATVLAALIVLNLPETQAASGMIMSDLLLAVLCLAASLVFARFVRIQTARAALAFGTLAALAALTKASGILLAAVPPIALLLSGNLNLLKNWRLWVAPIPVILTAIPWTLATYKITQEGMLNRTIGEHLSTSPQFYGWALTQVFGWPLLLFSAAGFCLTFAGFVRGRKLSPLEACLWSLGIATLIFYCLTPAGLEVRYLLPVVPCVVAAMAGFQRLPASVLEPRKLAIVTTAACLVMALSHRWRTSSGAASGYSEFAKLASPQMLGGKVIVSSDAAGEGALIASLAFQLPAGDQGGTSLLRSSKELSDSDWMGRGYQLKFQTTEDLVEHMHSEKIHWIIVDDSFPSRLRKAHHELAASTVAASGSRFRLAGEESVARPDGTGFVKLYELVDAP